MAIERFIENTSVFTREELMSACGSGQVNSNLLSKAKKAGKVIPVTRSVYASNTGRYRANETSPYLIAAKLGHKIVFAYGTALGLLTGRQDVSFQISFYSGRARRRIAWGDWEFIGYPRPVGLKTCERRLADGTVARITSKEQTICDCLSHPNRCGGTESLLRSLSAMEFVDSGALADMAAEGSKTLSAKVGWLLSEKLDDWNVSEGTIAKLKKVIAGSGPFYFSKKHEVVEGGWDAKWRLYFPSTVADHERWLSE